MLLFLHLKLEHSELDINRIGEARTELSHRRCYHAKLLFPWQIFLAFP